MPRTCANCTLSWYRHNRRLTFQSQPYERLIECQRIKAAMSVSSLSSSSTSRFDHRKEEAIKKTWIEAVKASTRSIMVMFPTIIRSGEKEIQKSWKIPPEKLADSMSSVECGDNKFIARFSTTVSGLFLWSGAGVRLRKHPKKNGSTRVGVKQWKFCMLD